VAACVQAGSRARTGPVDSDRVGVWVRAGPDPARRRPRTSKRGWRSANPSRCRA